jgi:hypothetical protein
MKPKKSNRRKKRHLRWTLSMRFALPRRRRCSGLRQRRSYGGISEWYLIGVLRPCDSIPNMAAKRIAREEKPVTADTALRLGKFFKTGAAFWMNIQARFDLETAEDELAPQIKKIASYEAA